VRRRRSTGIRRFAERAGVRDPRVLAAIDATPRERFVPPEHIDEAAEDRPVPLPGGQTTSQPSLIAAMVEALALSGEERVLEVGAGYGYQTALLAELARHVWGIERRRELAEAAQRNLTEHGVRNAEVVVGDGSQGLPDHAPFDGIIVSATCARVPPPLAEQLADAGRLVAPVGTRGATTVTVFRRTGDALATERELVPARFVDLIEGP